jgi:hypothetical protein
MGTKLPVNRISVYMDNLISQLANKRTETHTCATNHAAYLVRPGGKSHKSFNPAYYGKNYYQLDYATTHAEMDVISKVSKQHTERKRKKNKRVYNLIVIRVSKSGCCLGNSAICGQCINGIISAPDRYGIRIKKIYYSNIDGEMVKTTPNKLSKIETPYVSSFFNHRGYKSIYEKYK